MRSRSLLVVVALCVSSAAVLIPPWAAAQGFGSSTPAPSEVDVTGSIINLGGGDLATLRTPVTCEVGYTYRFAVAAGSNTLLPPRLADGGSYTLLNRRTEATVLNEDSKDALVCITGPLDAGVAPSCTVPGYGDYLTPGEAARYEINEKVEIWCQGCGGATDTSIVEASCVP